jgi:DNA-binding LacI/PurR family transcriptional regulator
MRVTLSDIAKRVGVAKTTVSMALRNCHGVSLARRYEIQRVAKEMGYTPDPFLSGLAAHSRERLPVKSHGVLAWVNHWKDPKRLLQFKEFNGYWLGAVQAASQFGYRLDEVRWERDCTPKRLERILLARGIDGVLIPPHHELLDWEDFDWNKFSVIRFGISVQNPDSNTVTSDVFRAIVMAVKQIRAYGYQRIGMTINEEFNERLGGNFLSGFFYAQKLLGLKKPFPPLMTFLNARTKDELSRQNAALKQWLDKSNPDAILTADIEVPTMLRELGFRIPQDLAVAGTTVFDLPGVDAGIDQHPEAIGRIAVEMLVKQINVNERGEPRDPCRILVESRWKDGNSLPPKPLAQPIF